MLMLSKTCGVHCLFQYRHTSLHDHDLLSAALQMYLKSSGGSDDAVARVRGLHLGGRAIGIGYSAFCRIVSSTGCNSCQIIHVSLVGLLELVARTLGYHALHLHLIFVQPDSPGQNLSAHHIMSCNAHAQYPLGNTRQPPSARYHITPPRNHSLPRPGTSAGNCFFQSRHTSLHVRYNSRLFISRTFSRKRGPKQGSRLVRYCLLVTVNDDSVDIS